MLKNMQESAKEWNISFAGCGFLMAYYCGVYSCLFERAPFLLKGVKKICGASSGALMGAILACQMSPAKSCENLLDMSRETRKGTLGAVHPSFDLLKIVRNFLNRDLPDDAHLLASGRLFVSLTRVSDGTNVLVSEFDSKEDLTQALICSCFYPLYCGVIPPRYHGIAHITLWWCFVRSWLRCVKNGYKDAFLFLKENELLKLTSPLSELTLIDEWENIPTSKKYISENKLRVT
ncbi:patatin-like phospholipase domain-containing protein 2 isoform X2 [Sinocyclocheilus anshuiensis]|uniref:patatin-like phospholipase domain-containing protein 2 isoform X2 n=1 Tax=Sinocyclocheilus anshuiensis TaxID=1608454 RepID=UPI0007B79833|nr:PREDICTED: patatin-like phospholipase domain-containing protein 2 isoform X2 [Sinocyclocheilus anshuiensis]